MNRFEPNTTSDRSIAYPKPRSRFLEVPWRDMSLKSKFNKNILHFVVKFLAYVMIFQNEIRKNDQIWQKNIYIEKEKKNDSRYIPKIENPRFRVKTSYPIHHYPKIIYTLPVTDIWHFRLENALWHRMKLFSKWHLIRCRIYSCFCRIVYASMNILY